MTMTACPTADVYASPHTEARRNCRKSANRVVETACLPGDGLCVECQVADPLLTFVNEGRWIANNERSWVSGGSVSRLRPPVARSPGPFSRFQVSTCL